MRQSRLDGKVAVDDTPIRDLAPEIEYSKGFYSPSTSPDLDESDLIETLPMSPGVYVLSCKTPHYSKEEFVDKWCAVTGDQRINMVKYNEYGEAFEIYSADVPSWAWAAFYSDNIGYVGSSRNIRYRAFDHYWGESVFTSLFPIASVHSFQVLQSFDEDERVAVEERVADELKQESPSTFVFQA